MRLLDQNVTDAVMLMLADHKNGLPNQRVEWIGGDYVERRIPGIVTRLPRVVDELGRRWRHCCKRPNEWR